MFQRSGEKTKGRLVLSPLTQKSKRTGSSGSCLFRERKRCKHEATHSFDHRASSDDGSRRDPGNLFSSALCPKESASVSTPIHMNPYGADEPGHYSSSADLVKLARKAMNFPLFVTIVSTRHHYLAPDYYHRGYPWDNILNPFLQGYPDAHGIKTGSNAAGDDWCMVISAYRHGHLLIGAEMQVPSEQQVFTDAENILNKG